MGPCSCSASCTSAQGENRWTASSRRKDTKGSTQTSNREARGWHPKHYAETRPERAIDARKHGAASKVAAVGKAVKALGRTGAPLTRVGVAQLARVSRSFTYENDAANSLIAEAQTRTQARAEGRIEKRTAQ
jgi:hypothetical protein